jgi:localization factor PodJL
MNSRVLWSVDGIDPSVRDRAEAAARRAGMSLNDWLNSTIGASAPPDFRAPYDQQRQSMPSEASRDVADIHQRLDAITRQIDQISKPAPRNDAPRSEAPRGQPTVARQLNDAISRLHARLSQISNQAPARQTQAQDEQRQTEAVERAAAQVYRASPPLSPASFDPRSRKSPRARTNWMARRRAVRRRCALTRPRPLTPASPPALPAAPSARISPR